MLRIKEVSTDEILPIRQQVLRKGKSFEACLFKGDQLESTYHLGVFFDTKLVGICTLVISKKKIENIQFNYQLRGMAVLEKFQSQRIGKAIMEHLPTFLAEKEIDKIWCNARIKAIGFYEKFQFKKVGKAFEIPDVGPHQLMYKIYA